MPNSNRKLYVHEKILCCLNIGFILTCLKKLMLRIWQRLLQNWGFYGQFSQGSVLCNRLAVFAWGNPTIVGQNITCLDKDTFMKKSVKSFLRQVYPRKPTRRQRPKAVGGASERSERGRSALFKNPLFFSGKFLGCYIEAAQNFFRYVQFSIGIGHKKITLLNWF